MQNILGHKKIEMSCGTARLLKNKYRIVGASLRFRTLCHSIGKTAQELPLDISICLVRAAIFFLILLKVSTSLFAASPDEIAAAVKNTYDKLAQTSTSLFNPEALNQNPGKIDPFFDKIRRKRENFFKERKQDQKKFFDKARNRDWDRDKLQEELNKFQEKQKEKIDKFMDKQQKKIDKHTAKQQ